MDSPLVSLPSPPGAVVPPPGRSRFLSEAECQDIAQRLQRFAKGGGSTDVHLISCWRGFVRWGRNRITIAGEDRDNKLRLIREVGGHAFGRGIYPLEWNDVSDGALVAAQRQAERLAALSWVTTETDLYDRADSPWRYRDEPTAVPQLFFESTYQLTADQRAAAAERLMQQARAAGLLSAGLIQVSAWSFAWLTSAGYTQYCEYTWAQCSMTVRDPKGTGSGWAGVDWPDWSKIEGDKLAAVALEKCLKSRNPVAIEPGRYTTILEPQAVADFFSEWGFAQSREWGEDNLQSPWHKPGGQYEPEHNEPLEEIGYARLGEQVTDERLTVSLNPLDPLQAFPPYAKEQNIPGDWWIYHPLTIIENGVLKRLGYDRDYATNLLGKNVSNPGNAKSFHISVSGPTQTIEEMIATTKRGLLVTRFDIPLMLDPTPLLMTGNTRDGVWLIEDGKVSKPVKNLRFLETCYFVLNNIEQVGTPQRTFHPGAGGLFDWQENPRPIVVPALKVKDFSFVALTDAV